MEEKYKEYQRERKASFSEDYKSTVANLLEDPEYRKTLNALGLPMGAFCLKLIQGANRDYFGRPGQ